MLYIFILTDAKDDIDPSDNDSSTVAQSSHVTFPPKHDRDSDDSSKSDLDNETPLDESNEHIVQGATNPALQTSKSDSTRY